MKLTSPPLPNCLKPPKANPGRAFYWFLLAAIVLAVVYLIEAEKPWNEKLQRLIAKREAEGTPWKVEHVVVFYEWFETLVNLVLAIGLFATLRLWSKALTGTRISQWRMPEVEGKRWLFAGLIAAVLLGGFFRVQRLDHSFWSDEEYTFRTHIWGQMMVEEDGGLLHQRPPWRDTVFRNKANNHIGFTVPTRLLHSIIVGDGPPVNEAVVRLIPLLAGLASIALIGFLVARHAGTVVGVATALMWALLPWHIQHSSEARGYSEMMLFLLVAFYFLDRALHQHRWRDWLAFGAAEMVVMLSYPGVVYVLVIANAMAFACICWSLRGDSDWAIATGRFLVSNILAGMAFFQIFAPSVPQIMDYLANGPLRGEMSIGWLSSVWAHCASGLTTYNPLPAEHIGTSFGAEAERIPGFRFFHMRLMVALVGVGIVFAGKKHPSLLLPGLATLLGALVSFVHNSLAGNLLWTVYVSYAAIGFTILSVLGVCGLVAIATPDRPWRTRVQAPALGIFLAAYTLMSATGRDDLCAKPTQPIRQVVALARGESPAHGDDDGGLVTASFGTSRGMIITYDPRSVILKDVSALHELIDETRAANKRLRIYLCGRSIARNNDPDDAEILAVVEDPEQFRAVGNVQALRELFSYHVYELLDPTSPTDASPENVD